MKDELQISERLLTAGQPTPDELQQAAADGWQAVINLARPDSPGAFAGEDALCRGLGMAYTAIPVDFQNPTREDLAAFFEAMEMYKDVRLLAHCALNMRVSAFVFLYRVLKLGVPEDAAREDLLSIWEPEGVWQEFIERRLEERI
ncbi:MAG: protein tyrosine phosphatase family protein [Anaerolineaceae bacterium]